MSVIPTRSVRSPAVCSLRDVGDVSELGRKDLLKS